MKRELEMELMNQEPKPPPRREEEEEGNRSLSPRGRARTLKLTYDKLKPDAAHDKLSQVEFKRFYESARALVAASNIDQAREDIYYYSLKAW
jgi:hypothetical protein